MNYRCKKNKEHIKDQRYYWKNTWLWKRFQEKLAGRSTKTPQEKTPSCMQNTIFEKYLIPRKNISNAKQDKLSNHRQEHPTKKIQEFLQKSLYSNLQSQEYKISQWDTTRGISSLYSIRGTQTVTYFFIQQLRLKHHQ